MHSNISLDTMQDPAFYTVMSYLSFKDLINLSCLNKNLYKRINSEKCKVNFELPMPKKNKSPIFHGHLLKLKNPSFKGFNEGKQYFTNCNAAGRFFYSLHVKENRKKNHKNKKSTFVLLDRNGTFYQLGAAGLLYLDYIVVSALKMHNSIIYDMFSEFPLISTSVSLAYLAMHAAIAKGNYDCVKYLFSSKKMTSLEGEFKKIAFGENKLPSFFEQKQKSIEKNTGKIMETEEDTRITFKGSKKDN